MARYAGCAVAEGYGHVKLHELAPDAISVARSAMGAAAGLMVDVNCAWTASVAVEAFQTFSLEDDRLSIDLGVRNRDRRPMPAGLGWHPYFPGTARVEQDAVYRWPHRGDFLPAGWRVEIGDSSCEDSVTTAYLQDWRKVLLAIAGVGRVTMTASPELAHLVVHRAGNFTCLEPVSHVANGFNLAAGGVAGTGTRLLGTGETLVGFISLTIDADG